MKKLTQQIQRMCTVQHSGVEEIPEPKSALQARRRENFIVALLYVLLILALLSFFASLYFSSFGSEKFTSVYSEMWKYCLSTLVGYVLGFNKNR